LSAVEHDYLKDGFVAENQAEELPADGLTVSFLKSMTDVTDRIMAHVPSVLSEIQRERAIDSLSTALIDEYENRSIYPCPHCPFLFTQQILRCAI
jgi:hypothetical protein